MSGVSWGDVPTWLASVFAAGAFAAALLLFRVEAKRDRRQEAIDRQAQASQVTTWFKRVDDELICRLQNSSASCVYEVIITYESDGRVLGYDYMDVLRPGSPAVEHPVRRDIVEQYWRVASDDEQPKGMRTRLNFRDSSNVCWKRGVNGYLTEGVPDAAALDWVSSSAEAWHAYRVKIPPAEE